VPVQNILLAIVGSLFVSLTAVAQGSVAMGMIHGTVQIEPSGIAARNAVVTIAELKRSVLTDENGVYEFKGIVPGKYHLFSHLDRVPDLIKTVEVSAGDQTVDFDLYSRFRW